MACCSETKLAVHHQKHSILMAVPIHVYTVCSSRDSCFPQFMQAFSSDYARLCCKNILIAKHLQNPLKSAEWSHCETHGSKPVTLSIRTQKPEPSDKRWTPKNAGTAMNQSELNSASKQHTHRPIHEQCTHKRFKENKEEK